MTDALPSLREPNMEFVVILEKGEGSFRAYVQPRYLALGQTDSGRRLFISFTVRGSLVRIISARDMSRKEGQIYEQGKA
jgi:uncharacterized DUF497 family protein